MIELLPCQKEAADCFDRIGGKGYLNSSVGSGKTILAAECIRRSRPPALYLTTKSNLVPHADEFRKYGLSPTIARNGQERRRLWLNPPAITLTTLESVGCKETEWELLRRICWGIIVIDEADKLTAGASRRNRNLLQMKASRKLMMTGTPLKNGLRDSYFPLMFLSPFPPWRNWTDFKNKELLFNNPNVPGMITGIKDENKLAIMMLKVTFGMVNPDAPKELTVREITVEMGDKQREAYEKMKHDLYLEVRNGTLTISNKAVLNLRLRQFVALPEALGHSAPSAKEQALVMALPKMRGKTIIFTSFSTVADILGKRYGWSIITGKTTAKKRKEIVDAEPDVTIATSAAERGLNMPYVKNVVCFDRGFTPAVMRQRAGRATRYGSRGDAALYLLTCPKTVDVESEAKIVMRKLKEAKKVCLNQR